MKRQKTLRTAGVVLDSGAFIALEKGDPVMTHLVERFTREATSLVTSAGVVAEIWRGGKGAQICWRSPAVCTRHSDSSSMKPHVSPMSI